MADVIEVLTLTQIKKLKVAELRERLQQLNKPTTGLKPELVTRLFEALFEWEKNKLSQQQQEEENNASSNDLNNSSSVNVSSVDNSSFISAESTIATSEENASMIVNVDTSATSSTVNDSLLNSSENISATSLTTTDEKETLHQEITPSSIEIKQEENIIETAKTVDMTTISESVKEEVIDNQPVAHVSLEPGGHSAVEMKIEPIVSDTEIIDEKTSAIEKNELEQEVNKMDLKVEETSETEETLVAHVEEKKEEKEFKTEELIEKITLPESEHFGDVELKTDENKQQQHEESKLNEREDEVKGVLSEQQLESSKEEEKEEEIKMEEEKVIESEEKDEEKTDEEELVEEEEKDDVEKDDEKNEMQESEEKCNLNEKIEIKGCSSEDKITESEKHEERLTMKADDDNVNKSEMPMEKIEEIVKENEENLPEHDSSSVDEKETTKVDEKIEKEMTENEEKMDIDKKTNVDDDNNDKDILKKNEEVTKILSKIENENEKEKDKEKDIEKPQKVIKERKRRWGSSFSGNAGANGMGSTKNIKGISSDSLKELIPDLNKTNTQVSNKLDTKKDIKQNTQTTITQPQTTTTTTITHTTHISTNISGIGQSNSGTAQNDGITGNTAEMTNIISSDSTAAATSATGEILDKRDIRIVKRNQSLNEEKTNEKKTDLRRSSTGNLKFTKTENDNNQQTEEEPLKPKEQTPPRNSLSHIIFIRNLVRPFTLLQLKDLLNRHGKINEDKFWIDKIKSKCYVAYENEEGAKTARTALHGLRWPDANPKTLNVDFANEDELEYHLNLDNPDKQIQQQQQQTVHETIPIKEEKRSDNKLSKDKYDIVIRRERVSDEKISKHEQSRNEAKSKERLDGSREREKRPIREWDREKLNKSSDLDTAPPSVKKRRSRSRSPLPNKNEHRGRGDFDRHKEKYKEVEKEEKEKQPEPDASANLLDGLFRKTKTIPSIYWLPLDEEQALKRAEMRDEIEKKRFEERMANAERRRRYGDRGGRRTPPYIARGMSPRGRGAYPYRRPPPPQAFRGRRERSESVSDRSSRSRTRSRSRQRNISRSRSKSHSPHFRKSSGSGPLNTARRSRSPRRSPRRR